MILFCWRQVVQREKRGTEQLLLRFSEPNQRFISLNPLSIRIPTNSSLGWLVTTLELERISVYWVGQSQCREIKEMILITAGWGQICPDRSDMFWHISWYLAAAPPLPRSQNTLSMLRYEMTRPSNTHKSYFIISLQCSYPQAIIFSSSSWSVIFIGQVLISRILSKISEHVAHSSDAAKPGSVLIIE